MQQPKLRLSAYTLTNALGQSNASTLTALRERRSGLRECDFPHVEIDTWIGRVEGIEQVKLPSGLESYSCRNNQLALLALEQDNFLEAVDRCRARYGKARIGLFLGTSTAGIHTTERAYRRRTDLTEPLANDYVFAHTHMIHSLSDFVARLLDLQGPALTLSTACSSSAKVFACAHRYIQAGLCDAAIVGGVDSLCLTTLYGFNALQLVSARTCRPWDRHRDGINIGEGAGFALLERDTQETEALCLLGYGESSDAHHIASPHPEGIGAAAAMQRALDMAGLVPRDIDYINLHGTATPANDRSESAALRSLFHDSPPVFSSTKSWTGHTLGAAGITEAIICCLALENGFLPGTLNTQDIDDDLMQGLLTGNHEASITHALSNSFGFGGSNCCLIFGKTSSC